MEHKRKILSQIIAREEFGQMIADGFRPGRLSLEESVRYFDMLKNRYDEDSARYVSCATADENEEDVRPEIFDLKESEQATDGEQIPESGQMQNEEPFSERGQDSALYDTVREVFKEYRIPYTEPNVREVVAAVRKALQIEEITDGMSEFIIRRGVRPTIENMYKLRFESEQVMFTGNDGDSSVDPDYEIIGESGLETDDFTKSMIRWMKGKSLLLTTSNVKLLYRLWTVNLPVETKDAVRIAAKSLRAGHSAEDALLIGETEDLLNTALPDKLYRAENEEGLNHTGSKNEEGPDYTAAENEDGLNHTGAESEEGLFAGGMKEKEKLLPGEEELRFLSEKYRELFLRTHTYDEYIQKMYEEYKEVISTHVKEAEILVRNGIAVTPDHLSAMGDFFKAFQNPEEENLWKKISRIFPEDEFAGMYKEVSLCRVPKGTAESCMERLWRNIKETEPAKAEESEDLLGIWRQLMLLVLLEEKGYYEVPLMWENRLQSLYFHEDERHEITALTVFLNDGPVMVKTCRPLLKETAERYLPGDFKERRILVVAKDREMIDGFTKSDLWIRSVSEEGNIVVPLVSEKLKNGDFPHPFDM